ncbi:hypothetical protein TNCV_2252181 [Trichonephila clavipes]|nr:hypothetical protein TNCV_2252181 [Trichonephila clavipes]
MSLVLCESLFYLEDYYFCGGKSKRKTQYPNIPSALRPDPDIANPNDYKNLCFAARNIFGRFYGIAKTINTHQG